MATPVLLPRQGQSVESCIITRFYVKPGDQVSIDAPLFAYETDKASFEETAKEEGTILTWFFEEGDEVPVLTNVGVIGKAGESYEEFRPEITDDGGEKESPSQPGDAKQDHAEPESEQPTREPVREGSTKIFISPRARNLAAKAGTDIHQIKGSGPGGRIIEADVRKSMEQQPVMLNPSDGKPLTASKETGSSNQAAYAYPDPSNVVYDNDSKIVPLTNIRKRIANAMHVSLQNSAQITHHLSADARRILELRRQVKAAQREGYEHNITLNDMVCSAVIRVLKNHPAANAHFLGESTRVFNKVHLGFAVDTERGLMVPTVKNADDLSIGGLSHQLKALAEASRTGNVNPDLLSAAEASFTVSNLGNYGVEMFTPVINLPQVAILGVNTILPRPKDLGNGTYGFVPHMGLSLTYDHRALDGGEATRFLKDIATEIENLELNI
ncbi:MAG: 2-oxo acid dehydrogenase subunit E2 [Bacteroidales bacterium]|nr:2-oxo acid dehydrogenase subunit E2 [Bacteroidales bacterium]